MYKHVWLYVACLGQWQTAYLIVTPLDYDRPEQFLWLLLGLDFFHV